jgi:purine-binding chemotaxis protein CheW
MSRRKTSTGTTSRGRAARGVSPAESTAASTMPASPVQELEGTATLVFDVAGQRFGLPVEHVVQIIEMVAITPLPKAPEIVAGVINFRGRVIPVVDVRKRLNLSALTYSLRTPIVISRIRDHVTGLIVDSVSGVVQVAPAQLEEPTAIFSPETRPPLPLLSGVARLSDGLILILDLGTFLSREEEKTLKRAMSKRGSSPS